MKRPEARGAKIDPTSLPASLRRRIEAAIALTGVDSTRVPSESRTAVHALRRALQSDSTAGEYGCAFGVLAFIGLMAVGVTWIQASVAIGFLGVMWSLVAKTLGPTGRLRRSRYRFPPEVLRLAGDVAGFGDIELAALDAALASRADAEIRAEVDRLLSEDERLRSALETIASTDPKSIEAERLRLRLNLARETDPPTRTALEASLALCERRHASATAALEMRGRIEAHRELILQSLRATSEALLRGDTAVPDLASTREAAAAIDVEVAAIEAAVQEINAR